MTPILAQGLRVDRSFERLYRRYVSDVYHYALAVCRNPADAEDVTQTTFMNAYRAVQAGEVPRAPKNWLIAIAHNVCRQRFRNASRRVDEVTLDESFVAATVPDDDGPSAQEIQRALGELAFNQRAALVMRELEGRSYADIAEILGVSVSAVETLIFRARRALREQLEGSLTCREAELAISKQLDGRLPRSEKGALRAHLRTCKECATFARSQRAQRAALKSLAAVPLPASLGSFFGGGGAAVGTALAGKAAAVTAVGLLVTGAGVEAKRHGVVPPLRAAKPAAAKRASAPQDPQAPSVHAAAAAFAAHARVTASAPARPARAGQDSAAVAEDERGSGEHADRGRHLGRGHGSGGADEQTDAQAGTLEDAAKARNAEDAPRAGKGHGKHGGNRASAEEATTSAAGHGSHGSGGGKGSGGDNGDAGGNDKSGKKPDDGGEEPTDPGRDKGLTLPVTVPDVPLPVEKPKLPKP